MSPTGTTTQKRPRCFSDQLRDGNHGHIQIVGGQSSDNLSTTLQPSTLASLPQSLMNLDQLVASINKHMVGNEVKLQTLMDQLKTTNESVTRMERRQEDLAKKQDDLARKQDDLTDRLSTDIEAMKRSLAQVVADCQNRTEALKETFETGQATLLQKVNEVEAQQQELSNCHETLRKKVEQLPTRSVTLEDRQTTLRIVGWSPDPTQPVEDEFGRLAAQIGFANFPVDYISKAFEVKNRNNKQQPLKPLVLVKIPSQKVRETVIRLARENKSILQQLDVKIFRDRPPNQRIQRRNNSEPTPAPMEIVQA